MQSVAVGELIRILDWNMCSMKGKSEDKSDYLRCNLYGGSYIAILQEVKPHLADRLREAFEGEATFLYSLERRPPSRYDSGARDMGLAVMVSDDIEVTG